MDNFESLQVRAGYTPEPTTKAFVPPLYMTAGYVYDSAEDAQAVCGTVRAAVSADHGDEAGRLLRVQYGGSVKASNIASFMSQPDIDGALVGTASLDPAEFAQIVRYQD